MNGILAGVLASLIAVVAATGGLWYARRYPNISRTHPSAQRLPKFFPFAGWLVLVAGALILMVALGQGAAEDPPMTIAGVGVTLLGVMLLIMYRNFWIIADPGQLRWRTFTGRERQIALHEVTEVRQYIRNGQVFLRISSPNARLDINPRQYRIDLFLQTLQEQGKLG